MTSKPNSFILITLIIDIFSSSATYAYIKPCHGTRHVVSCEFQIGHTDCRNYYEGEGCRAINCRIGFDNHCRASHTPRRIYCLQPFYPREYCEIVPSIRF